MPGKKIPHLRHAAFTQQSGRCYYCGLPMCQGEIAAFARQYGLSPGQAKALQCTAEHLQARQDGGLDTQQNIAAACSACNARRHQAKKPKQAAEYRAYVQNRIDKGKWHTTEVLKRLKR